jgi:hypothetical protein
MRYCFRIHWYADREEPLNAGSALNALTREEAISHAIELWCDGVNKWSFGYVVVDTDEGEVIWRQEREPAQTISREPEPYG